MHLAKFATEFISKIRFFPAKLLSSKTSNQNEKQKFETFSTEPYFVQNFRLSMILKKFLKFPCDSYKKNSYKETRCRKRFSWWFFFWKLWLVWGFSQNDHNKVVMLIFRQSKFTRYFWCLKDLKDWLASQASSTLLPVKFQNHSFLVPYFLTSFMRKIENIQVFAMVYQYFMSSFIHYLGDNKYV